MESKNNNWQLEESIQQAQYLNKVNQATLPGPVKDFLRYIGSKATYAHTKDPSKSYKGCYASQDVIEIQMARSRDYVTKAKKKALDLGWIAILKTQGSSDEIFPRVGKNDPTMKIKEKRQRWITASDQLNNESK